MAGTGPTDAGWVEAEGLVSLTLPGPDGLEYLVEPLESRPVWGESDDTEPLHRVVTLRLSVGDGTETVVEVDLSRGCVLTLDRVAPDGCLYLLLGGNSRYDLLSWRPGNDAELLLEGGDFIARTADERLILTRDLPCDAEAYGFGWGFAMPMRSDCSPPGGISQSLYQQYLLLDIELEKILEPLWLVSASSYLADDPADCSPARAIDGDIGTAWVEGVEGDGVGESLTLELGIPTEVWSVALLPGYCASPELWRANGRPREVRLVLSDGTCLEWELEDDPYPKVIYLGLPFAETHMVSWLRLTILSVYPGERWADTAVSELTINFMEGY